MKIADAANPPRLSPNLGYETRDASLRIIGLAGGAIGLMIVGSILTSLWLFQRKVAVDPLAGVRQTSFKDAPARQNEISVEKAALEAQEKKQLDSYAWVDQATGVVRIPITRAMQLVVKESADAQKEAKP